MIRAARKQDLPRIMAIYDAARRYMRQNGNPTQWGDNYPPESMLRQDIARSCWKRISTPTGCSCTW